MQARANTAPRRCAIRIEHRWAGGCRCLGDRAIDFIAIATRLAASGQCGEVVIVDAASGEVIIRQRLLRPDGTPPA